MTKCVQCTQELKNPVISMSAEIMGDEYIETFYFCDRCQIYTIDGLHDVFDGEESYYVSGPLSKVDGDKKIELIKRCSQPWNKKCTCAAHKEYFGQ